MSTFTAAARIDDGTLYVSRPLTAPEPVRDMIDALVYTLSDDEKLGEVTSFEVTFETAGESDTPVGDSITGSSSMPYPPPTTAASAASAGSLS
jgi:hypothetical protein